jgi:alpha-maltose-1-phosphate synthase
VAAHRSPARIAFVCEGDAERDAFSGTARSMVIELRRLGHAVRPINVRPPRPMLLGNAALSYSFDRARWRARFRYGRAAFFLRSLLARRGLERAGNEADVILQIGATFAPPGKSKLPYALYCDWNMALSMQHRDSAQSATSGLSVDEMRRLNEQQRAVYRDAAVIFTISERLRRSFIEDYDLRPDRLVTAYPGANVDLSSVPPRALGRPAGRPPTVLFIGNEFERKGGDALVRAFRAVRARIADARLMIVGPTDVKVDEPGVDMVGRLRKDIPEQGARLLRAFVEADVFCLPSRLDPFPNVVREAMFFGLPCVTTDIFAFSEMVVNGESGFTVGVDDEAALSARLVQLLEDDALRHRMGRAGKARAQELFTWAGCGRILSQHLERIRLR